MNQMAGSGDYCFFRKDIERPRYINNQFKAKLDSFLSIIQRDVRIRPKTINRCQRILNSQLWQACHFKVKAVN